MFGDKRIRHIAGPKAVTLGYIPSDDYGKNGDTVYVKDNKTNTTEEFVKTNGKWISLITGRDAKDPKRRAGKKGTSSASVTTVQNMNILDLDIGGGTGTSVQNHHDLLELDDDDHTQYVHNTVVRTVSAAHSYTGNVNFSGQPAFSKASGTPFTVTSTSKVANLNVDQVDGKQPGTGSGDIAYYDGENKVANSQQVDGKQPGTTAGDIAYYDGNVRVLDSVLFKGQADTLFFKLADSETVTGIPAFNGGVTGTSAPFTVDSTNVVTNLNADLLDGNDESAFFKLADSETVTGIPAFNGGATGTSAPFTVDSADEVSNLNASLLSGKDWDAPLEIGGTTAAAGSFTTLTGTTLDVNGNMTITGSITGDAALSGNLTISSGGNTLIEGTTFNGNDVTIPGDLTVSGATVTMDTATVQVEDQNIYLAYNNTTGDAAAQNAAANAGGVSLKAAEDKHFVWYSATDRWTASEVVEAPGLHLKTNTETKITFEDTANTALAYIGTTNTGDIIFTAPSAQGVTVHADNHFGGTSFVSGFAGSGWRITKDASNEYNAEFDNLIVRGTMSVYELLIQQIRATNGSIIVGSADKIDAISNIAGARYKFTIESDGGDSFIHFTDNDLIIAQKWAGTSGDPPYSPVKRVRATVNETSLTVITTQADCDVTDDSDIITHGTNAAIVAGLQVSGTGIPIGARVDTIETSNRFTLDTQATDTAVGTTLTFRSTLQATEFEATLYGSDTIETADLPLDFVRVGNTTDTDRQGGIYLTADDSGAPFIDIFNEVSTWAHWRSVGYCDESVSGHTTETLCDDGADDHTDDLTGHWIDNKTKARLGRLVGITHQGTNLSGYGLYSERVWLTGNITATSGYIGTTDQGWTIGSDQIHNGNVKLNANNETIQLGTVADFTNDDNTKSGIFMGKESAGNYDFFVGKENSQFLHYDDSLGTIKIKGTIQLADGTNVATGLDGDIYATTSTTELDIPTSHPTTVTLTVATGLAYTVGQSAIVANTSSKKFTGTVTSYTTGTGVLILASVSNTGTDTGLSSWSVNLEGAPGPQGEAGTPATTYYTWIKYATDSSGTGLTDTYTAGTTTYIGMAFNKTSATESTTAGDYTWNLIEGSNGSPGTTYYTWVKYGTSAAGAGLTDTYTAGTTLYVGMAFQQTSATESTTPGDYTWSLIEGTDGVPGTNGDVFKQFYVYQNKATAPATPTAGAVSAAGVLTVNSGESWTATSSTPSAGTYTWISSSIWKQTAGAGTFAIDTDWSTASQLSGATGDTGADNQDFTWGSELLSAVDTTGGLDAGLLMTSSILGFHEEIPDTTPATTALPSHFKTYMDSTGDFYLTKADGASGVDGLTWDSSEGTLTITGSITLTTQISSSSISDVGANADQTSSNETYSSQGELETGIWGETNHPDVNADNTASNESYNSTNIQSTVQGNQITYSSGDFNLSGLAADAPSGQGDGLYMDATHLGFYEDGVGWKTYMDNGGDFFLSGQSGSSGDGSLVWDSSASTLSIQGGVTATSGYIGGWTIDGDGLVKGSGAQVAGALNLQMHSSSSTAGTHFYSWGNGTADPNAYLAGYSLTWHEASNAGHIVLGQLAASTSTLKTGFFGLQMMTHTGTEFFALSAKSTGETTEVYNRIAGWEFDNTDLYKDDSGYIGITTNASVDAGGDSAFFIGATDSSGAGNTISFGSDGKIRGSGILQRDEIYSGHGDANDKQDWHMESSRLFGDGADGNCTLSKSASSTELTYTSSQYGDTVVKNPTSSTQHWYLMRDAYFDTLTFDCAGSNASIYLHSNGFRLFVRNKIIFSSESSYNSYIRCIGQSATNGGAGQDGGIASTAATGGSAGAKGTGSYYGTNGATTPTLLGGKDGADGKQGGNGGYCGSGDGWDQNVTLYPGKVSGNSDTAGAGNGGTGVSVTSAVTWNGAGGASGGAGGDGEAGDSSGSQGGASGGAAGDGGSGGTSGSSSSSDAASTKFQSCDPHLLQLARDFYTGDTFNTTRLSGGASGGAGGAGTGGGPAIRYEFFQNAFWRVDYRLNGGAGGGSGGSGGSGGVMVVYARVIEKTGSGSGKMYIQVNGGDGGDGGNGGEAADEGDIVL